MKSQSFQAVVALIIVTLAFSACGLSEEELAATSAAAPYTATPSPEPPPATPTHVLPTPTSTSTPTPTSAAPDNSVQAGMFRLVPSGFLSAAYCDVKTIREDPDLKSIFEAGPDGCPLLGMPDDVDASLTFVLRSSVEADSTGITISAVTIRRGNLDREAMPDDIPVDLAGVLWGITISAAQIRSGNFDSEALPEYIPEDLAGVSFQDYQRPPGSSGRRQGLWLF
jgi:hypothetical protein